jgi:hypothetical protein
MSAEAFHPAGVAVLLLTSSEFDPEAVSAQNGLGGLD